MNVERRDTDPQSPYTAAFGDPAITIRCGVDRPPQLTPTSELISVGAPDGTAGIDWLPVELTDGYRFVTIDRVANVEVDVPNVYAPETGVLVDLAGAVNDHVPVSVDPPASPEPCGSSGRPGPGSRDRSRPTLGKRRRRRAPRHRVDLVEDDAAAGRVEEVDPGETLAGQRLERLHRQLAHLFDHGGGRSGGMSNRSVVEVLRLEVVVVVAGADPDLGGQARLRRVVVQPFEDAALDLAALDGGFDDDLGVVLARGLDRLLEAARRRPARCPCWSRRVRV